MGGLIIQTKEARWRAYTAIIRNTHTKFVVDKEPKKPNGSSFHKRALLMW